MSGAPLLTEHVMEKAAAVGLSAEWRVFHWQALYNPGEEPSAFLVEGAVAPIITRGKRKGERDWKRLDPITRYTFYVTPDQHQQWLANYEASTGQCFNCTGKGQEFAGWSAAEGTKYRPCSRCNGSGRAA